MLPLAIQTQTLFRASDALQKYSDADVVKMLEHLIGNIFVGFAGRIF